MVANKLSNLYLDLMLVLGDSDKSTYTNPNPLNGLDSFVDVK